MKWIKLLRIDDCALLQSETDTQYVVVSGYDPTQPEDQQWASGTYFEYWNAFYGLCEEKKNGKPECKMEIVQIVKAK